MRIAKVGDARLKTQYSHAGGYVIESEATCRDRQRVQPIATVCGGDGR
jgi:hypothetical protein